MADKPKESLPKNATDELGKSGTYMAGGVIVSSDYNRDLSGLMGMRYWNIMRMSDSTVHNALQVVKLPLLATSSTINAPRNKEKAIETADQFATDFIKNQLFDSKIKIKRFLKDVLTYCDFGFSAIEIVYEIVEYEGRQMIGIQKLAWRKPTTIVKWELDDGKPGIVQMVGSSRIQIPIEKVAIFTYEKEGDNPLGTSLLRHVFKDWDIKDKLTLVNAMALEKLGVGLPYVKARDGETLSAKDEAAAIDALQNIRANNRSYMKIPKTAEVGFLDLKGNTTKEIIPTLNYHDGRIMTGVMARFTELGGASGTGSQSLSTDLSSFFMKAEYAMAEEIAEYINEQIIQRLCDFNFTSMPNGYPQFTFGTISDTDPTVLATSLQNLTTAGVITPDADLEQHVRKELHLPEMSDDTKEAWERKVEQSKNAPVPTGDPTDDGIDEETKQKVLDKAKEDAKKKKPVDAMIRDARAYRDVLLGMTAEG